MPALRAIEPFFFSAGGRQLYGVLHPASGGQSPSSTGVLLCGPFGTEAVRVHRMQRVLADRLARTGLNVMRFDYYGTGESEGEDEQGEISTWQLDVGCADRELRRRTGCDRTVWVGLRLGATLAALAASSSENQPSGLLMWEPVVDGNAYLAELLRAHARSLLVSYGNRLPDMPHGSLDQASGFAIGAKLRLQLSALTVDSFQPLPVEQMTLVTRSASDSGRALTQRLGQQTRKIEFDHSLDWTAEEAVNTALVPADALKLLSAEIESLR